MDRVSEASEQSREGEKRGEIRDTILGGRLAMLVRCRGFYDERKMKWEC